MDLVPFCEMKLSPAVKIAALASLLIALFEMPDEFYKILRFVVLAGAIFAIWGVQHSKLSENWKTALTLSFSLLGIIFNPVLPLEMERSEWRWFNFARRFDARRNPWLRVAQ